MIDVMDAKDLYLSQFAALEKKQSARQDRYLSELRSTAIESFAEQGFPTLRDEEWRFTPLSSLVEIPFQLAEPAQPSARDLQLCLPQTGPSHRITLINGSFAHSLSETGRLPTGVQIGSLAAILAEKRDLAELHLAKLIDMDVSPFVALNTAFLRDGFFIYLPRGTVLREPLHLVYLVHAETDPTINYPRTLIVCEGDSKATIVQSYVGVGNAESFTFTNAVTEMILGPNAHIQHCKVLRESDRAYHFETLQILQNRGSHFTSQAVTLGSRMARNEINAVLNGEACECTLNGLYVGNGTQHIENRTSIDHAMPHCNSHELYKGILGGKSKGVFNGKIFVRQDAQKTDAKQTNRTLLLSDEATINSKPQLEIFADDVKCTHGATVGQLAAEAIFYLRSRGIGMEQARAILTYAFAADILQHITVEPLRRELEGHFLAAQNLPADLREEETAL